MIDSLKSALTSKKFLATIIGAVVVALGSALGISDEQTTKIAGLIVAYVLGQGVADMGKEKIAAEAVIAEATKGNSPAEKAAALEDA